MHQAIMLAKQGASCGEVPVGAVLVCGDAIIASAHNGVETLKDPTAHAEMLVLREGARLLGTPRLVDCDLYVTLEPCPMCAQAISFARVRRLYFGAYDPKGGGVDHGPHIFGSTSCFHVPEVVGGLEERVCSDLLKSFFNARR